MYITPAVVNRTKPNQKPIEPNRSIGVRLVMRLTLQLFPSAAIAQSPDHVVNDQAGCGHRQLPSEPDPYLLFSA